MTVSISAIHNLYLNEGDYIYLEFLATNLTYLTGPTGSNPLKLTFIWTAGSFKVTNTSLCIATKTKGYFVNEAMSRIIESYTDDCMRVYSEYFGRTDAQPYTSDSNGCGALEVITSGLLIRNANQFPNMTVSMKDMFEALNAIHNIGIGMEDDPNRVGHKLIRVEPYKYFYNDSVIMTCKNIGHIETTLKEDLLFSTAKIGYEKWETETVNGLDDVQTQRDFRTSLHVTQNGYEKLCKFIASDYSIEVTRREYGSTSKDWRYDNSTFIICVKEYGGQYETEDFPLNSSNSAHLLNAGFNYNLRITPLQNAIRHLPVILESLKDYTVEKLIFTNGTGNYLAEYDISADGCIAEVDRVKENQNIAVLDLKTPSDFYPILRPELAQFDYPLTYNQWTAIMANPYGLIEYSCGETDLKQGWIEDLKYSPYTGLATFTLRPKI